MVTAGTGFPQCIIRGYANSRVTSIQLIGDTHVSFSASPLHDRKTKGMLVFLLKVSS